VIYFFFTHSFSKDQKTEIARRSTLTASEMRDELDGVKEAMHEEKITKMDIAADMSRQYKSMQTQMEMRIQFLEEEVKRLTSLLGLYLSVYVFVVEGVVLLDLYMTCIVIIIGNIQ
jgi:hypothetical protein